MIEEAASTLMALGMRASLRDHAARGDTIALIDVAARSGWFGATRSGATYEQLAALTGCSTERARLVTAVLRAAGVLNVDADVVHLSASWTALVADSSSIDCLAALADIRHRSDAVQQALTPGPQASDDSVLALDWGLRATPGAVASYDAVYSALPEFRAVLDCGGPLIDVGSGVGGALISTALLFPGLRAVGVERSPEVAVELARRIVEAGIEDRVQVDTVDTADLRRSGEFACAYWAQEFFAPTSRAGALAAISRALQPDGLLLLQELLPPATDETAVPRAVEELYGQIIGTSFGSTAEQLLTEAEGSGFRHISTTATPAGRLVLVRRG